MNHPEAPVSLSSGLPRRNLAWGLHSWCAAHSRPQYLGEFAGGIHAVRLIVSGVHRCDHASHAVRPPDIGRTVAPHASPSLASIAKIRQPKSVASFIATMNRDWLDKAGIGDGNNIPVESWSSSLPNVSYQRLALAVDGVSPQIEARQ
jgi:hypothetical protein